MKKKTKNNAAKDFWEGEFKLIVSPRLNALKGKKLPSKKLDLANKQLSQMTLKGLPK